MKDKLKIGMYVRTNEGFIARLIDIKQETFVHSITTRPVVSYHFDNQIWDSRLTDGDYDDQELIDYELNDLVVKPSFDIMDMIKEGDYVNGKLVVGYGIDNLDRENIKCGYYDDKYGEVSIHDIFYEEDIKSIVTKEQFKAMEYKIEEEI